MKWKKEIIFAVSGLVLSLGIALISGFFPGFEIFYFGKGSPSGWPFAFRAICPAGQMCPDTPEAGSMPFFGNIVFWIDVIFWFLLLYVVWLMFGGTAEKNPEEGT